MRVVLGLFNSKVDTGSNIRYVGTKEHFEEMIKKSTYMFDGKLPITLSTPIKGEFESAEDYYKRVLSIDKKKIVGMVSKFEIVEIPQDYIFNQMLLTAEVNIDARFGDTNCSIGLRGVLAPMTIQDVVYGDIQCDYKIDKALSRIICFDLEDRESNYSTVEDFLSELYAYQPMDKEEALKVLEDSLGNNNKPLTPEEEKSESDAESLEKAEEATDRQEVKPSVAPTYEELFTKEDAEYPIGK